MESPIQKGTDLLKKAILPIVNPSLAGNFAPVQDELVVADLPVIGEIPKDLTGIYMRNGPNPQFPTISYIFPFDGDGMIHAVYIDQGKAEYRNRYVETRALLKERRAGKALYGSLLFPVRLDPEWADPEDQPVAIKNGAFIHIIRHAGKYLALKEKTTGYEMTKELKTLGEWDPYRNGRPINVSPHTRFDPLTGDLWLVNFDFSPPYLNIYHIDSKGDVAHRWDIDKPRPSLVHDFVLTERYVIVFDCPAIFDLNKAGPIMEWMPELGVQIGIMPRSGGDMKWFQTDPFFVYHFANAYEQGDEIIIDYVRYETVLVFGKKDFSPKLYRTIVNIKTGTVTNTQMDDRITEFPRIREDRDTLPHQYIYIPTKSPDDKPFIFQGLVKYDMTRQRQDVHDFGDHAEIGEAVFVPAASPTSEDDGYLMLFAYNNETEQSEFVILDAKNMGSEPLARVQLPRRIPHGLHGTWMSGPWRD